MSLNSEGRVVLNIRDSKGSLLVARPCKDTSEADRFTRDWILKNPNIEIFVETREIPPRI